MRHTNPFALLKSRNDEDCDYIRKIFETKVELCLQKAVANSPPAMAKKILKNLDSA